MKMNGGRALVKALEDAGVEVVFGYPGGVALPIFDALYDSKKLRSVLPRHEQAAVHMADGYARVTGKPAAVIVTSGPGATNTVTGIANAYMDSVPMVVITAQVATPVIGTDAFQESDITGITLPITKHNYLVKDANDLVEIIAEAFHIASTGRPGPVLVDVPADVSKHEIEYKWPESVNLPGYKPTYRGHAKQVKQAVALIAKARSCTRAAAYSPPGRGRSSRSSRSSCSCRSWRLSWARARSRRTTTSLWACPGCTAPSTRTTR
jgi:acetolactate synthase-1/2/3 large subunit